MPLHPFGFQVVKRTQPCLGRVQSRLAVSRDQYDALGYDDHIGLGMINHFDLVEQVEQGSRLFEIPFFPHEGKTNEMMRVRVIKVERVDNEYAECLCEMLDWTDCGDHAITRGMNLTINIPYAFTVQAEHDAVDHGLRHSWCRKCDVTMWWHEDVAQYLPKDPFAKEKS